MVFLLELLTNGGDRKITLELVKKVGGIQACFNVSDFCTGLGEITLV